MDLREAIYSRRAVREYTNAAVDEKTLAILSTRQSRRQAP